MTVSEAYNICENIARREAKNFYYSFRVLPKHKRNAMCAVYAFMRRADDVSDDESMPLAQRRIVMIHWMEEWRIARRTGITQNPVFFALNDAQSRFAIPDSLLEQLVQGTTMDLDPRNEATEIQTFSSFDELYQYCYLVASVVGLVCIRIFGYTDIRAEKLAEETGVAFQLTNILRDVKEDIDRGRVYLPLDMLAEFNISAERIRTLAAGEELNDRDRALLSELARRADLYYMSAAELLPLIDSDSRAALWVLVAIYHELLVRIRDSRFDVFSTRVSVSTRWKLWVLIRGTVMGLSSRIGGRTKCC